MAGVGDSHEKLLDQSETEAYLGPCQTSKMDLFEKIVNNSITHLYFSAFISALTNHYLMLLDFILQELIIDSIVVKDR